MEVEVGQAVKGNFGVYCLIMLTMGVIEVNMKDKPDSK